MSVVYFTDRDLGIRFPAILREAGLSVERHDDHFRPDSPDEEWLRAVGKRGWVALSHDRRIRYKPNELAAVIRHDVRLLIIVGKLPLPALAESFVASQDLIGKFLAEHPAPLIAKVYRASPESPEKRRKSQSRQVESSVGIRSKSTRSSPASRYDPTRTAWTSWSDESPRTSLGIHLSGW